MNQPKVNRHLLILETYIIGWYCCLVGLFIQPTAIGYAVKNPYNIDINKQHIYYSMKQGCCHHHILLLSICIFLNSLLGKCQGEILYGLYIDLV